MRAGGILGVHRSPRICGAVLSLMLACGCIRQVSDDPAQGSVNLDSPSGMFEASIAIDGSSTVYPISQAMAVEFRRAHPAVSISVSESGTTNGFKAFIDRRTAICDASRPITEQEIAACRDKGIEYVELEVAIDGLSVVVNPRNDWVSCISTGQLRKIWDQDSAVEKWSDVDPAWPNEPLKLFGAGTQSGTFDYFTEVINGKARQCRTDYSQSENDNVLVEGVAGDKFAMAFFGYAYFAENQDQLKPLAISEGEQADCVVPTPETIERGTYTPLSRPLFIYVNKDELQRPEVAQFVEFYLSDEGQAFVAKKKYIKVPTDRLAEMRQRLAGAR